MRSFDWKARASVALALAASAALPQHAFAQFFFRPFAYSYQYQIPDREAPAFASRRAVASIIGREGYRLVGPLGHRGEQIVVTGVNRREGEMRFVIDPYEGRILRAVRLGARPMYDRGPRPGGDYGPGGGDPYASPPTAGSGPVGARPDARNLGNENLPGGNRPPRSAEGGDPGERPIQQRQQAARKGSASKLRRASARAIEPPTPSPDDAAAAPPATPSAPPQAIAAPAREGDKSPAAASTEPQSEPAQAAKDVKQTTEKAETPPEISAEKASEPATAQTAKTPDASPAPSAPAKRTAARPAGGSSRRAIVPPPGARGMTVVTPAASAPSPSTAAGSATAKTPDAAAKSKVGG